MIKELESILGNLQESTDADFRDDPVGAGMHIGIAIAKIKILIEQAKVDKEHKEALFQARADAFNKRVDDAIERERRRTEEL